MRSASIQLGAVSLLILVSSPPLGCRSAAQRSDVTETSLERQENYSFSFSRPSTWQIVQQAIENGDAFTLQPPKSETRTKIIIVHTSDKPRDVGEFYGHWLAKKYIPSEKSIGPFVSVKGTPTHMQVSTRDALQVRWTQGRGDAENLSSLLIMPNGESLEVTLSVSLPDQFEDFEAIHKRIVESLQFK